ncbi:MAG: ribulose-phosphate 3-epimerase [Weeksellaceae bacterium]|nr:ribulose-phosphate 3-epimerase [Weeksellaceae bacterium]
MALIAPSVLAADFLNLQGAIDLIENSAADWYHLDIMDGLFVPNISYGQPVVEAINRQATKPLDVHLMIMGPDRYIDDFCKAGAHVLTVHWEACTHLHRTVHAIRQAGMKAGVSLNPHTPVSLLEDILADVDLVLLMSVNPGFGGQKFIERTYAKISELKDLKEKTGSKALIEIDGGVGLHNAEKLVQAGADVLVAGSAVFGAEEPQEVIERLKKF